MDVLSEVLRVVRLTGAIHFRGEFRAPWGFVTSTPQLLAVRLNVPGGAVTPFHVFMDGRCFVTAKSFSAVAIEPGDVVIVPRADQHVLTSDVALKPVPISSIYTQPSREHLTVLRHGGDGAPAHFMCGFLHSDLQFDPLLAALPTLICVRGRNGGLKMETWDAAGHQEVPIASSEEAEWWQASLRYLISEAASPGAGNRAVLARLSESLFLQVLRWQLRHARQGSGGWLAALHDPQVGRVLNLMHALPERAWTTQELAREAAMSRAALGKRFSALVGQSPIHYLASWRMQLARRLLRETTLGVAEIAARVGYESEPAFNRAFHRLVGAPPAAWRRTTSAPD